MANKMAAQSNTTALSRLSVAAVIVSVLAGLLTGSLMSRSSAEAQNGAPEASRTAYVDFLGLLKEDKLLARKQVEIGDQLQQTMDEIDSRWEVKILAQKKIREQNKPHTKEYRDAMYAQLEAERKRYQEKLLFEQLSQEELRKFGITRFKELRNLTRDLAKGRGYNEVLNIVGDVDKLGSGQDDFQALQQQLLVSPVLYYEAEHDITELVRTEAKKIWDEFISMQAFDKEKGTGGIEFTVAGEAAPLKRNAEGEIEIRLGQKGAFKVAVLYKGEPAPAEKAGVRFTKRGLGIGEFTETGLYTAPDAFPVGDKFVVTVRSAVDPTIEQTVTIRLLDKDGKRMPPK